MDFPCHKYVPVFTSAVRTSTNASSDFLNDHGRGVTLAINMATVPGTDTVTFIIDGKDPLSGAYYAILSSTALIAAETRATGNITLTGGASGSINTARVAGVSLIAAAVNFTVDLNTTAAALATAINALTATHGYTANAVGAVVTITAPAGSGTTVNGYVVTATLTTITATFGNMAAGVSGTTILRVYPGLTAAANLVVSDVLPRAWRVRAVHSAASNFTYTVGAQTIL